MLNKSTKFILILIALTLIFNFYINIYDLNFLLVLDENSNLSFVVTEQELEFEQISIKNEPHKIGYLFLAQIDLNTNSYTRTTSSNLISIVKVVFYLIYLLYLKINLKQNLNLIFLSIFLNLIFNILNNHNYLFWINLVETVFLVWTIPKIDEYFQNNLKSKLLKMTYLKLFLFLIIMLYLIVELEDFWKLFNIPYSTTDFLDMRGVQGSINSLNSGYNPYFNNPGDPTGRLYAATDYLLYIANFLELNEEIRFYIFTMSTIIIFLISIIYLSYKKGIIFIILLFSSSTLLAIERGQPDLVIFILLLLSYYKNNKFSGLFLLFATILKIYPIVSFVVYIVNKRRSNIYYFLIALLMLIYKLENILYTFNNIYSTYRLSFGLKSLNLLYKDEKIIFYLFLIFFLFYFLQNKHLMQFNKTSLVMARFELKDKIYFLIGCSIYCSLFLITSSFDYKLIFLIFTVPILIEVDKILNTQLILNLIIASNYLVLIEVFGKYGLIFNLVSKLYLFIALSYLLVIFLNEFIKNRYQIFYFGNFFKRYV